MLVVTVVRVEVLEFEAVKAVVVVVAAAASAIVEVKVLGSSKEEEGKI